MESVQIVVYAVVEEYRSVRDRDGGWYKVADDVDMTNLDRGCAYSIVLENNRIVQLKKIVRRLRETARDRRALLSSV